MRTKKLSVGMVLLIITIFLSGCKETPIIGGAVDHKRLVDGVYEGEYTGGLNNAMVKVTIENKRIVKIEIVKHGAMKGKKAEPIIPGRVIEKQSTSVDAVTGATNSSRVIMNAIQKAIEKSYGIEDPSKGS